MSQYIEFFAAPSDAAAAAVRTRGPATRYAVVDASNVYFDADDAVIAWRNLLTGRAGPPLSERDDPRMVADFVNDGSAVFALPDELVTGLIKASLHQLRDVAEAWVPAVVADGTEIDVDAAVVLMSRIAELARAAAGTRDRLYCWVAC
ncbi:hypothetical protein AMIS_26390 [Actinoplanes missouriensis 431]|uniref:Uncharacterized protein n=1 Tax=Actinoplanes missouriensis (strain ATCC 14538 / DSM 43046 / CBS 188.64 / JCM 3121 / NBRC 102363 / NCIMB 12654 / NRRL B-3342 / UNCC 431) TaxID=512565 RepID=I0H4C2_ACTM4|nr:hypothetical protein [Actinoplanes missouriensis]BAL87859.1 hypothetical protein AMIS_26390 [Actinoplanes missouriensis 431]